MPTDVVTIDLVVGNMRYETIARIARIHCNHFTSVVIIINAFISNGPMIIIISITLFYRYVSTSLHLRVINLFFCYFVYG